MEEFGKKIESKGNEEETKQIFKEETTEDENLPRQTQSNSDTGSLNGPNAMTYFQDANIRRELNTSDLGTFEHKEDNTRTLQSSMREKHQNYLLEIFQQISSQSSNHEKPQKDFPEIGQPITPQSSGYQQQRKPLLETKDGRCVSQSCTEKNEQSSGAEFALNSPSVDKIVNVFSPNFISAATFSNTTSETTAVCSNIGDRNTCQQLRDEAKTMKTVIHTTEKMKHSRKLPDDESFIGEVLEIATNVHKIEDSFSNNLNERQEHAFTDNNKLPKSEVSSFPESASIKAQTGRKDCLLTMDPAAKNLKKEKLLKTEKQQPEGKFSGVWPSPTSEKIFSYLLK